MDGSVGCVECLWSPVSKNSINCFPFFFVCFLFRVFFYESNNVRVERRRLFFVLSSVRVLSLCVNGNGGPVHIHHPEHRHVPTVLMCFVVCSTPWYLSMVVFVRDHDRMTDTPMSESLLGMIIMWHVTWLQALFFFFFFLFWVVV